MSLESLVGSYQAHYKSVDVTRKKLFTFSFCVEGKLLGSEFFTEYVMMMVILAAVKIFYI